MNQDIKDTVQLMLINFVACSPWVSLFDELIELGVNITDQKKDLILDLLKDYENDFNSIGVENWEDKDEVLMKHYINEICGVLEENENN